ncbi:ferric-chelate reductase (NADH) [Sarracenia purpurea var. burkii]
MLKWDAMLVSNVAGELSLLFGLFLWATTYSRSGKNMFELFFYTHYFYILFIIFYVFHLGISFSYTFLPGFYLFLIDRFLRFLQSRRGVRLVSARVLPCQTLELNFSKTQALSYTPTSMVFINVPSISKLQWHPFTISSSSNLEPDGLSVLIKNEGTWTEKLYEMLSSKPPVDRLVMSVEGPYGPISTHFLRYDKLVMVSGGSGIAPFISLIRELIFLNATIKTITPPLLLISSFKHSSDLAILDLLLPISTIPPSELHSFDLRIEPYVTRDRDPPFPSENQPIPIKTIWFDPNASSDSPMSPVLGPNGWIWLAAIISSSFVVFLIFVGILTRFYIYPIDHNTNRVYSHSAQAALNMMLICVSIAVAATAAVLWNMKGKAMEARDIQNAKGAVWKIYSHSVWSQGGKRKEMIS